MPEKPAKTAGTLTLGKPREPATTDDARANDKTKGKASTNKTGARAHHRTRLQTEQRRVKKAAPTQPASSSAATTAGASQVRKPYQREVAKDTTRDTAWETARGSTRTSTRGAARGETRPSNRTASKPMSCAPDLNAVFTIFAPCPRGLEQALATELTNLGFAQVHAAQAGCRFQGNWHDVWRANLCSRLATRILVQLSHATVNSEDDLRALALDTGWEQWMGPDQTLRVDTSAIRSPMQSLQYCNLLVKDSVCDRLRDKEGERPSVDTVRPDVRVHTFLSADSATLYLDTSGESLFKRGWRFDKTEAPIRENLAAGLLAISGWQPHEPLLDPFCGSGTILIEAAWQALGIAPGINRPFAFERLRVHDRQAWQHMRQEATESIKDTLPAPIVGGDLAPHAIEAAKANAERAGLKPDTIEWRVADATTFTPPTDVGQIVTNPPYGERLIVDESLMPRWATQLKQHYAGWRINVISADLELPGALRLKPKRRVPLFNGALDCRLFMFDMVNDQYQPRRQPQATEPSAKPNH